MPAPTLTIGQAAAAAGVTRKAVRVYEAKGLLRQADRSPTGYRLYDHHDVELLIFIRRARTLGLHVDDIGQILTIRNGGAPPCAAVRDLLDERIANLDATVTDLLKLRQSLISTRARADDCCEEDTTAICRAIDETPPTDQHLDGHALEVDRRAAAPPRLKA